MGNEQSSNLNNDASGSSSSRPLDNRKRSGEKPDSERTDQRQKTSKEEDLVWWRDDPKNSFSDWVIEIYSSAGEPSQVYNVHRMILARGARRSNYFVELFQNGAPCFSKIELTPLAASTFPCLLDYIYGASCNRPLEINSQTATALHYLGEYFEVAQLCHEVEKFCLKDIALHNATLYYSDAITLKSTKIRNVVVQFLGKGAAQIGPSSPILKDLDSQLCEDILRYNANEMGPREESLHMSKLLAAHCVQSAKTLDLSTFRCLTDPSVVPSVDPSVAITLAELERQLAPQSKPLEDGSVNPLQERCVAALSKSWRDLKSLDEETRKKLVQQDPRFLVELLTKSLYQADNELQNPAVSPRETQVGKKIGTRTTDKAPRSRRVTPRKKQVHRKKKPHGPFEPTPLHKIKEREQKAADAAAARLTVDSSSASGGAASSSAPLSKSQQEREKEMRRQKERFLMFTRVLMKYLETKDPGLHQKVKTIIKDCAERNKRQERGYESVTASMRERLKHVVGDAYWKRAESYLAHFLAQKQKAAEGKARVDPQRQATK